MTNNPNLYTNDFEQRQIDKSEAAIEWMDTMPNRISLLLLSGAHAYGLQATKKQFAHAMELIKEALGDLFNDDRHALMETAGYTPEPKSLAVEDILRALRSNGYAAALINPESVKQ